MEEDGVCVEEDDFFVAGGEDRKRFYGVGAVDEADSRFVEVVEDIEHGYCWVEGGEEELVARAEIFLAGEGDFDWEFGAEDFPKN